MTTDTIAHILRTRRTELCGYLRSVARDRSLADDIFQDISLKAIQRPQDYQDEQHLLRWLHVAGKNRAIDHFRQTKKQHLLLDHSVLELLAAEADEVHTSSPALSALDLCIQTLTPRSRRIIALRYGDELSGIEVAKHLNQKVDTIYKALARIYTHLRRCVLERTAIS